MSINQTHPLSEPSPQDAIQKFKETYGLNENDEIFVVKKTDVKGHLIGREVTVTTIQDEIHNKRITKIQSYLENNRLGYLRTSENGKTQLYLPGEIRPLDIDKIHIRRYIRDAQDNVIYHTEQKHRDSVELLTLSPVFQWRLTQGKSTKKMHSRSRSLRARRSKVHRVKSKKSLTTQGRKIKKKTAERKRTKRSGENKKKWRESRLKSHREKERQEAQNLLDNEKGITDDQRALKNGETPTPLTNDIGRSAGGK